jgi:acetylornithine deacetylase/succinyl-diaminopimelate desuccinylase-like protein
MTDNSKMNNLSLDTERLESLKTFLRIPSISADPAHKPDIRLAAEFCASELRQAGMTTVELIESAPGPKSEIRNPKSPSGIRNPKSKIPWSTPSG